MFKRKEKEMVSYWKTGDSVQAKVFLRDGYYQMQMKGEKYPFPGFPRGRLLFGKLSKLKHEVKNQLFNDIWWRLEAGEEHPTIIRDIRGRIMASITRLADSMAYDMVPPERMVPPVREIWRAMTKIEDSPNIRAAKVIICFVLQEDDAYRFRFQWVAKFVPRWMRRIEHFDEGVRLLEHAEIVGDMKERSRLFRRIFNLILEDSRIRQKFTELLKELDWSKIKLTKADKYFFRAKYFKVDYPEDEY